MIFALNGESLPANVRKKTLDHGSADITHEDKPTRAKNGSGSAVHKVAYFVVLPIAIRLSRNSPRCSRTEHFLCSL